MGMSSDVCSHGEETYVDSSHCTAMTDHAVEGNDNTIVPCEKINAAASEDESNHTCDTTA